jgi:transcriptional regulator with PAS, ATPase and Fis domain
LKNLAEQISVLEIDRQIGLDKFLKYLPQQSSLPALINKEDGDAEHFSERDLLYKVLFDMKGDMTELKKLVLSLLKGKQSGGDILKEHEELFQSVSDDTTEETPRAPNQYLLESHESKPTERDLDYEKIEDITHETEDNESLSIEAKEKELIIKALLKNKNKRKYAAKDLGISERTLYRKIKQYEIEEL